MAKAFDKFYRADASDTAVAGVGLGMSIVKHIVEAHGGKIWMESEVGRGTTVRFTLPLIAGSGVETETQACGAKDPAC
jgi:signal transduction histidine kinase